MTPELRNPTVVIVDDRIDLETQITAKFIASDIPNMAMLQAKKNHCFLQRRYEKKSLSQLSSS
jgi:type I site-specific restriction-modification system R (restriction) subunit